MPEVAFIAPRLAPPLAELIDTLRYELGLQGVPSMTVEEFPGPRPDLVYVLADPRGYIEQYGPAAVPDPAVLKRTIGLGSVAPDDVDDEAHLNLLRSLGTVFDTDDRTVAAMRRRGIGARPLHPGYSRSRDHYDPGAERAIDVLFLGAGTPRQTELLTRFTPVLERRNCLLRFTGPEPYESAILGPERWSLLARSKILLNLHANAAPWFETLHAYDAIHAGAVVVSEPSSGLGALEPGRDLLVGDGGSLPFLVQALLDDESRLARIRADAYERLRSWLPFALSVSIFRAAIIEVLGAPIPNSASLGRRGSPSGPNGAGHPQAPELGHQMDDARRELHALRDELAAVRREAAQLKREAGSVEIVHRSPAWSARREPAVTVLTAVLDADARALETLDCAAASAGDRELVVVVAGANDGPVQAAEGWARANPRVATTVIADRVSFARGGARNTGMDAARGRSVLILDPGTTIRARCLARLAEVLSAMDEVTFVYPMIEVVGAREWFVGAGGDSLLNTLDWDPRRLRDGNPVHAPYLVRTAALRRLGGFAVDVGLDGFEDYDLWARIAEDGGRGQLLAQVLAARVELPGSRSLQTIAPGDGPAWRALIARAPRTMAGAFPATAS